jgi:transposase-like protein
MPGDADDHFVAGASLCTRAEQTLSPHLKPTNRSYRTDETYIKVRGEDKYLYRAVDSTGQTIEFLPTA